MTPRQITAGIAASISLCLWAASGQSATITDGGTASAVTNWYSSGYGNYGWILFDVNSGEPTSAAISPSVASSGNANIIFTDLSTAKDSGTSALMENETGTATNLSLVSWGDGGLNNDNFYDVISFSMTNTPSSLRVGALVGACNTGGSDYPTLIRLTDGAAYTNEYLNIQPSPVSPRADWYFFDVTNISAATVLTVYASRHSDGSGKKHNRTCGVVFAPIPEEPQPPPAGGTIFLFQ